MPISVRVCELKEILPLRELYRKEMDCQIIHDSIHVRRGWSIEHALELDGEMAGYGSVAVAGPWADTHAVYEFYVEEKFRQHLFELFAALLENCSAAIIETQTNDPILTIMLHTFGRNFRSEAILFEDGFATQLAPANSAFRPATAQDVWVLKTSKLDEAAAWVVTSNGAIAGAGGVLYHYNRPYGDIYYAVAEPFRRRGLGAYLAQELKRVCRAGGSVPAARCNTANEASRRTLQKAGFVPCGNGIAADVRKAG